MTDREFVRRYTGIAGRSDIARATAEAVARRLAGSPDRGREMRRHLEGLRERVEQWDGAAPPRRHRRLQCTRGR